MHSIFTGNNRGIVSVLSAFVLVIIMLVLIFGLLLLNSQIAKGEQELNQYFIHFQKADDYQTYLNTCLNGFSDNTLDNPQQRYNCIHNEMAGYEIKIPPEPGITIKYWKTGRTINCEKKFSYIIDVFNPQTNITREGLLKICLGERTYETPPLCDEGTTRPCGTSNIGACQYGTQTCTNNNWTPCNSTEPVQEICNNGIDEDCDGADLKCPIPPGLCQPAEFCLNGGWPRAAKLGWPSECWNYNGSGNIKGPPYGVVYRLFDKNPNVMGKKNNVNFFVDPTTDCEQSVFFGNKSLVKAAAKFTPDCKALKESMDAAIVEGVIPIDAYGIPLTDKTPFYKADFKAQVHYKITPGSPKRLGVSCNYSYPAEQWQMFDETTLIDDGEWHWTEGYAICGITTSSSNNTLWWAVGNGRGSTDGSDRIEVDKLRLDICPKG